MSNKKHSKKFKTEDTENFFESSQRELISPIPHPQGQTNPAITNSSYVSVQSVHLFVQTTKIKNKKLNNYSYAAMISLCIYFVSITLQFAHIFNQKSIFFFHLVLRGCRLNILTNTGQIYFSIFKIKLITLQVSGPPEGTRSLIISLIHYYYFFPNFAR